MEEFNLKKYKFHPLANIFPLCDRGPDFQALVEDISRNGLLQPIVHHEEMILDGRRRYLACKKAGVAPKFLVWDGIGLPIDFVISVNALRRQLSPSQLAVSALKSLPFFQKGAKQRQRLSQGRAQKGAKPCATLKGKATEMAAKRFGISVRLVEMAKAIQDARPKLIAEIDGGRITVSEAYEEIAPGKTPTKDNQSEALEHLIEAPLTKRAQLRQQLGPDYYCYAIPEWVRRAIVRDYGYPDLDVAANYGSEFGKRHYEPKENGLRQNWHKDAKGGLVWCNPPYDTAYELHKWVTKCWEESQKGCTVIAALPFYRKYDWFKRLVRVHAEVRFAYDEIVCKGFGPMKGRKCGNIYWDSEYETLFAIFRPKQTEGYCGAWLKPVSSCGHSMTGPHKSRKKVAA